MAYEAIIARSPRRETSLAGAAQVASELRQWELALSYARRLVAINPWIPDYRRNLILILSQLRLWDDIQTESQAWMRLDSTSIDARIFWIASLIRKNKNAEADAEFAKVELLRPAHLNALQDWFARQARGEISLPPISGQ